MLTNYRSYGKMRLVSTPNTKKSEKETKNDKTFSFTFARRSNDDLRRDRNICPKPVRGQLSRFGNIRFGFRQHKGQPRGRGSRGRSFLSRNRSRIRFCVRFDPCHYEARIQRSEQSIHSGRLRRSEYFIR